MNIGLVCACVSLDRGHPCVIEEWTGRGWSHRVHSLTPSLNNTPLLKSYCPPTLFSDPHLFELQWMFL